MRIDRLAPGTFDLSAIIKRVVAAEAQFQSLDRAVGRHRREYRALYARGIWWLVDVDPDLILIYASWTTKISTSSGS